MFLQDSVSFEDSRLFSWFLAYFSLKLVFRKVYDGDIWGETSLIHNFITVMIGLNDISTWPLDGKSTCFSLYSRPSLAISIQVIHCLTDAVYYREMYHKPILFWHHVILLAVSLTLPYCPGCFYVISAYTLAEAGSASIAIDHFWRLGGLKSTGFYRLFFFGITRILNLYFLYQIVIVTPTMSNYSLSMGDSVILTTKLPICLLTNIFGSSFMLLVNGVTWYRMYKMFKKTQYVHHRH